MVGSKLLLILTYFSLELSDLAAQPTSFLVSIVGVKICLANLGTTATSVMDIHLGYALLFP